MERGIFQRMQGQKSDGNHSKENRNKNKKTSF